MRQPPQKLFDEADDSAEGYPEALNQALTMISDYPEPIIGHQILVRNDEVIDEFVREIDSNPSRTKGDFDLGVSPTTSCVIRSVDSVTSYDDRPNIWVRGRCDSPFGRRIYNVTILTEADGIYVSLGTSSRRDTFYGANLSILKMQELDEAPYVLAVDVDINYDFKESLRTCVSRGGIVRGAIGYQWCAFPYSDAGTECLDSSECEGLCLLASGGIAWPGSPAIGECEAESPTPDRCATVVSNGEVLGSFCP